MTGLFDGVLDRGPVAGATGDTAWLQALLDVEAALAHALADTGRLARDRAESIAAACAADRYDPAALGRAAAGGGNPVIPLVEELTGRVRALDPDAARHVHRGATSQDVLDTAAMLVARRAGGALLADLRGLADELRDLAAAHRDTPMAGRTLLQQALPTTFGAVAAGWANGLAEAADQLDRVLTGRLAVQLGGAVGTLASLGEDGPGVTAALAARLDLADPVLPWHTERGRIAELASALGRICGAAGTAAQDVVLLAQTEVGELVEDGGPGVGGSSTLPHKRNPVAAVSALACARQAPGLVANLLAAQIQEHQRAAGGWHAEWLPLTDLFRRTGGAVAWLRTSASRLRVVPGRMRANLGLTGGLALSERVTTDLAPELGRTEAHHLVADACRESADSGRDLADVLTARLDGVRTRERVLELLDPSGYLGAAAVFTDRVTGGRTGRGAATAPGPGPEPDGGGVPGGPCVSRAPGTGTGTGGPEAHAAPAPGGTPRAHGPAETPGHDPRPGPEDTDRENNGGRTHGR
ncbi:MULTISPECIES: 3-carboxy-cis,cis-muconate cycloisomerase [Nocardiopsidaceae]|uniref:3-carboxy-cis,cis-muconate cycloisomerase n=1 Tax=Streptomonospora nanhaiensis TaxID=1323731 RepID=A0ABY6YUZ3_9ACTN|nr:3-carboxy-cis,cis-muconate cycloisomerase [Streptomonospora nanhaiensis]WAE76120.1 3-carboxy-cis,cis-muconate cycloisomerase [Streptomonospora nanhaiensis]